MAMSPLEQDVIRTVAWFSLFETPVTVFEMWKWMIEPARAYRLEEVYEALDGEALRVRLVGSDGFWTLRPENPASGIGHLQGLALERRARFLDAVRKYAKLRRAARYFAFLPMVESVSAANTLAWWNTREESDIDLYVVTRPGAVWTARLLMVAPFALLGKRPGASATDPFCFSFFASSDAPAVSTFAIAGGDPYLDLWRRSLVRVYGRPRGREAARPRGRGAAFVELVARRVQLRRLPPRIKRVMNGDTCVVVNDQVLKFHENDRREEYRERWKQLISNV